MNDAILRELENRHSPDIIIRLVAWGRLERAGFAEASPASGPGIIGAGVVFSLNAAGRILEQERKRDRTA
jgi:hypothetical protein